MATAEEIATARNAAEERPVISVGGVLHHRVNGVYVPVPVGLETATVGPDGSTSFAGPVVASNSRIPLGLFGEHGDSITQAVYSYGDQLANYASGQLHTCYDGGVIGERSDQILARLPNILNVGSCPYDKPKSIILQMGTNDPTVLTVQQTLANDRTAMDWFAANGIHLLMQLVPPRNDSSYKVQLAELNIGRTLQCARRRVDILAPWDDYYNADASGNYAAGASSDGVHPTSATQKGAAQHDATVILRGYGDAKFPVAYMQNDGDAVLQDCFNVDTNADGIADGWSAKNGTGITYSLSAATIGKAQKFSGSVDGTGTPYFGISRNLSAAKNTYGDLCCFTAEILTENLVNATPSVALLFFPTEGGSLVAGRNFYAADSGDWTRIVCFYRWGYSSAGIGKPTTAGAVVNLTLTRGQASTVSGDLSIRRACFTNLTRLGIV